MSIYNLFELDSNDVFTSKSDPNQLNPSKYISYEKNAIGMTVIDNIPFTTFIGRCLRRIKNPDKS